MPSQKPKNLIFIPTSRGKKKIMKKSPLMKNKRLNKNLHATLKIVNIQAKTDIISVSIHLIYIKSELGADPAITMIPLNLTKKLKDYNYLHVNLRTVHILGQIENNSVDILGPSIRREYCGDLLTNQDIRKLILVNCVIILLLKMKICANILKR